MILRAKQVAKVEQSKVFVSLCDGGGGGVGCEADGGYLTMCFTHLILSNI